MTAATAQPDIAEHEPLANYTSWRVGGAARYFAQPKTPDALLAALGWAEARGLVVHLLGGGTNSLFRERGWPGLVIRYRDRDVQVADRGDWAEARIGAGAPMAGTARWLARQGWAGLEWAEGLPGTIGGAIVGNAGCYGGDVAGALLGATLLAGGEVAERDAAELGYGYRSSALKRLEPGVRPIVLGGRFRLTRSDAAALAAQMEQTAQLRKSKTPWGASCGSVFKNPAGASAGQLIEAAGMKGRRVGAAQIAEKHANYIVNLGGATSDDILALIELARAAVLAQSGIALDLEVQIVG